MAFVPQLSLNPLGKVNNPIDSPLCGRSFVQPRAPIRSKALRRSRGTPVAVATSPQTAAGTDAQQLLEVTLKRLKNEKAAVDSALESCLHASGPRSERIVEAMRYSLLAGGKRIRPVLCLAAFEMFAGRDGDRDGAAMPSALAVEMIHTMSLIHDDLPAMDNDDLRRGRPTCHVVYGEDTAILAGDALLAYAYEYVARETRGVEPARVVRVIQLLGECVGAEGLAGGQVMDLEAEGRDDVSIEDLTWIHTHKTAALLRVSVAIGAILGGASDEDVDRVSEFAVKTGLAFQIADDVLDCTQTSDVLGKTAGKDVEAGKATYPALMGIDGAKQQAERLVREAKLSLDPYGERAMPLLGLADFIIKRAN